MIFGWLKKKSLQAGGPDFSAIDSHVKADAAFQRGELEKIFLMPLEFGGSDNPLNTLYVPAGVAAIMEGIDQNVIGPLAADGTITQYKATPEYQGNGFIPVAITIVASDPGSFTTTINIWGAALSREQHA